MNPQGFVSAGIGISTLATGLAAATSVGIFSVSSGLDPAIGIWPEVIATFLALVSLSIYPAVLVFGLASLFRRRQEAQHKETRWAAVFVFIQGYTAVIAVLTVIVPRIYEVIVPF